MGVTFLGPRMKWLKSITYTWCTLSPVVVPELLDEKKLKQAFLFHLRNDNFTRSTNWYDVKQNEHLQVSNYNELPQPHPLFRFKREGLEVVTQLFFLALFVLLYMCNIITS